MGKTYRNRLEQKRARTLKASICNIWINLGNKNPYTDEHVSQTARRIAFELSAPVADAKDVVAWVRDNRPELLRTAKMRRYALLKNGIPYTSA